MNATQTFDRATGPSDIQGIAAAILLGFCLIFVAGISHSAILHDAAHDQRHAIAFPCH